MSSTAPRPSALSSRDRARLQGVHPDLIRVIERARTLASFIVTEGLRTRERQAELVRIGASQTMNSRHLTGHAVDIAYWIDDGDGWVVWGGDWTSFRDGPHFELDRRAYP